MSRRQRHWGLWIVAGLVLVVGLAEGANVVQRKRGTWVFDRVNAAILAIAGTDVTATAAELNFVASVPASLDFYPGTLTTNFVGVAASTCKDSAAITTTGAAGGEPCDVGIGTADSTALAWSCYVSAANAAKIRICNPSASVVATGNVSTAYRVRVWK